MYTRLTLVLPKRECTQLARWAADECRLPQEQLRYLLRQALFKRGLLERDEAQREEASDATHCS